MTSKAALSAIVATATAAFLAGHYTAGEPVPAADTKPTPAATASSTSRGSNGEAGRKGQSLAENASREAKISGYGLATQKAKLEDILRNPDAVERNRALLNYLDRLQPGEFEKLAAHFQEIGIADERNGEFNLLLGAWAKADAIGALTFAEENLKEDSATATILSTWAMQDPDGAIRWAQAHHEGDGANPYMVGIIQGLATQDPERATKLLTEMPFSEERGSALAGLLPAILSRGQQGAKDWAMAIGDEQLRSGVLSRLANQFALSDPAGTAEWLKTLPSDTALSSMDDVLGTWVTKDKDAAVSYFNSLSDPALRTTAMRGMVGNIADTNPQEALAFMDAHPQDVDQRTTQQFLWSSFDKAPGLALDNVSRISNPQQQQRFTQRMFDSWARRDSKAAESWLRQSNLSNEVKDQLAARLTNTPKR